MLLKRDWNEFRVEFPELAVSLIERGKRIYEMGAIIGQSSDDLKQLCELLEASSPQAYKLLGLSSPLQPNEVLKDIFSLGAQMLFDLEEGRPC